MIDFNNSLVKILIKYNSKTIWSCSNKNNFASPNKKILKIIMNKRFIYLIIWVLIKNKIVTVKKYKYLKIIIVLMIPII